MKQAIIIGVIAVVVIGFGIFLFKQSPEPKDTLAKFKNKTSRELALMCEPQEYIDMHIHPVLKIYINGQEQIVPSNIGIKGLASGQASTHEQAESQASCLHFLHTHDANGTLHVESPLQTDYQLSDFFAVWGQTFTKDQLFDNKASDTHRIRMTVNGQENTEYENLILRDKDLIQIYYEAKPKL